MPTTSTIWMGNIKWNEFIYLCGRWESDTHHKLYDVFEYMCESFKHVCACHANECVCTAIHRDNHQHKQSICVQCFFLSRSIKIQKQPHTDTLIFMSKWKIEFIYTKRTKCTMVLQYRHTQRGPYPLFIWHCDATIVIVVVATAVGIHFAI